jgi:hypothetical protein
MNDITMIDGTLYHIKPSYNASSVARHDVYRADGRFICNMEIYKWGCYAQKTARILHWAEGNNWVEAVKNLLECG